MSKLVEFSTQKRFQIGACVVSARKAKHLDVTTMFTYSLANTPLGQSERAYYLNYFINWNSNLKLRNAKRTKTNISTLDFYILCQRKRKYKIKLMMRFSPLTIQTIN